MKTATQKLADLIEDVTGFVIRKNNYQALEDYALKRAEVCGGEGVGRFVEILRRKPGSDEWRRLLNRITIKESYLFRGQNQIDALAETVIPELAFRRSERRLTVWSAGCARGEEAVTLAIVLAELPSIEGWDWSILGTDVDEQALAEAREGSFGARAVARVPPVLLRKYFNRRGDRYHVQSLLKDRITYKNLNLADTTRTVDAGMCDLIFLRNVLIYFRPDLQRQVVNAAARQMTPDGSLFLGPSESLLHVSSNLRPHDLGSCFCYRHPDLDSPAHETTRGRTRTPSDLSEQPTPARVEGPEATLLAGHDEPVFEDRFEAVASLLDSGNNVELALEHIDAMRCDHPENALSHALEGMVRQQTGDDDAAVEAFRAALYLDPGLDSVRFLLARALCAAGRLRPAAREYRGVLTGLRSFSAVEADRFARLGLPSHDEMLKECQAFLAGEDV